MRENRVGFRNGPNDHLLVVKGLFCLREIRLVVNSIDRFGLSYCVAEWST